MVCPSCGYDITHPRPRFCPECGQSFLVDADASARTTVIGPPIDRPRSSITRAALKYVRTRPLTQLYDSAALQRALSYFTAPDQTYQVLRITGGSYAIWCGGSHIAWLPAASCTEVYNVANDLSLTIPGFLGPYTDGDTRRFRRVTPVPMSLVDVPYTSMDYRALYQWLGDAAGHAPTIIGYVRQCTQVGSRNIGMSQTVQHLLGRSTTAAINETINHYQLIVEDLNGSRHSADIRHRALYIPQHGDYVVLWMVMHSGGNTLVQGLQRDVADSSNGRVIMPRPIEELNAGLLTKIIVE